MLYKSSMTSSLLNYLPLLMVIAYNYALTPLAEAQTAINMQVRGKHTVCHRSAC